MKTADLSIALPAEKENLEKLLNCIRAYAEKVGFECQTIWELELIADEILTNIIDHAYPDGHGDIEVKCFNDDRSGLKIKFYDSGIPFNLLSLSECKFPSDITQIATTGFGIFLIRHLADSIDYCRKDNRNCLIMSKRSCTLSKNVDQNISGLPPQKG